VMGRATSRSAARTARELEPRRGLRVALTRTEGNIVQPETVLTGLFPVAHCTVGRRSESLRRDGPGAPQDHHGQSDGMCFSSAPTAATRGSLFAAMPLEPLP
jgi:hypothetical protein